MKNQAKEIVHHLYNSLHDRNDASTLELKIVLMKVYQQLDNTHDVAALISKLLTYIYTNSVNDSFHFNHEQTTFIEQLQPIARPAAWNAPYRAAITKDSF